MRRTSRHGLPPGHHRGFGAAVPEYPATGAGGTGQTIPESLVAGAFAVAEGHSRASSVDYRKSGGALCCLRRAASHGMEADAATPSEGDGGQGTDKV